MRSGKTGLKSSHEMAIPKSLSEVVSYYAITVIVIFFVFVAFVNFCKGVALIASSLWLALVTAITWSDARRKGGLQPFFISLLGILLGRRFVESDSAAESKAIRFGFRFCGKHFIEKCIPLDRIGSVEWRTGQATARVGRDMNDWQVLVWSAEDPYGVGPACRREKAEALGLLFVAFLREAGLELAQGSPPTCFVKCQPRTD